jgi:hypothetical protein
VAESEYMTATEARLLLGISKGKLAQLIRERVLVVEPTLLDKRAKLIRRADVEALMKQPRTPSHPSQ